MVAGAALRTVFKVDAVLDATNSTNRQLLDFQQKRDATAVLERL